ncbi:hypothetical protein [Comamonas testosteroni]|uniref:Uncharacterized protein n=1 Tax=Comamonas testosteroni TaxID=285 RepID=A0A8B4S1Z2_COMTE|nr:hypothetical protein [Comamonas testosteroni]EHN65102.1 hypothetical protein CTATCC11996_14913 [Comamonas testosteroni ATCC 11996]QQN69490.1 hypothetical protein IYN88_22875 [Comamonas testosteroni]SUY77104.1 Uncharacterised protein [Comamonas testosteroni]
MSWIAQCQIWCKDIKGLGEEVVWVEKPSRSNYLLATSKLLNAQGVAIPNLEFKGEYRIGRHGNIISYALMYRHGKELRRVFMVEVYPQHVRSHIEPNGTPFFGPHMHLGDERLGQVSKMVIDRVGNTFHQWWLEKLRRHTRILDTAHGLLEGPMGGNLFSR